MFCKNCGKELNPLDKFCNNCGAPIESVDSVENAPINELPVEEAQADIPAPQAFVEAPIEEPVVTDTPVEPVIETPAVEETPTVEPAPVEPTVSALVNDIPAAPVSPVINSAPVQKKNNAGFIIIIIVLALIILGVGGFIAYKVFVPKKDTPSTPAVNTPSNPSNPTPVATEDKTKVKSSGYVFTVPTGFEIYEEDGVQYIKGKKSFFVAPSVDTETPYSDYKETINYIASEYTSEWNGEGFYLVKSEEMTYGGKKFLYIQLYNATEGFYAEVVISQLNDGAVFGCVLYYTSQEGLAEGYNGIIAFMNSAKEDGTGTFAKSKITSKPGYKTKPNITLE